MTSPTTAGAKYAMHGQLRAVVPASAHHGQASYQKLHVGLLAWYCKKDKGRDTSRGHSVHILCWLLCLM